MDRRYIGSVTATTHEEKGTITLESNLLRGTVLPAPHGKGNKCDFLYTFCAVEFVAIHKIKEILMIIIKIEYS